MDLQEEIFQPYDLTWSYSFSFYSYYTYKLNKLVSAISCLMVSFVNITIIIALTINNYFMAY